MSPSIIIRIKKKGCYNGVVADSEFEVSARLDVIHASICHQDAEDCLVHAGLGIKLWGMLVAVRKGQVTSILNNRK